MIIFGVFLPIREGHVAIHVAVLLAAVLSKVLFIIAVAAVLLVKLLAGLFIRVFFLNRGQLLRLRNISALYDMRLAHLIYALGE